VVVEDVALDDVEEGVNVVDNITVPDVDEDVDVVVSDVVVGEDVAVDATSGVLVAGGNGAGSTADKLSSPYGIFVTSNSIYIVDQGNHRVQNWVFGIEISN
ncbi:unnamed protein product, partial [Rotaria sp. Silwood2]